MVSYRSRWSGLVAALALAAAVRLWHLGHGLPELPHVDSFKFVGEALRLAGGGDWAPRVVQHPGLVTNLLAALYWLFGVTGDTAPYLVARAVATTAGIALVAATWLLAERLAGARVAAVAALLAALCPVAVTASRSEGPDTLLALFVTLTLWSLAALPAGDRRALVAGALSGLAVGSKFTGLLLLPVAAIGAVADAPSWTTRLRRLALWTAAVGVVFTLTTPLFWAHAPRYLERLAAEATIQRCGQIGRVQGGWLDYLTSTTPTWEQPWLGTSLATTEGWIVVVAAVAGIAIAIGDRRRPMILIAAGALAYLALIAGPGRIKAIRFLLPVLPLLQVLAGLAVARAVAWARPRFQPLLVAALAALLAAAPLTVTVDSLLLTTSPTTNRIAEEWVGEHLVPGTKTLLSPFFVANLGRTALTPLSLPNVGARQYGRPEGSGPSPERDPIYSAAVVDQAIAAGIEVVVLNSWFDDAFTPVAENLRYFPRSVAAWQEFRARLAERGRLLVRIEGYRAGRLGPDIEIWRLEAATR